MNVYEAVIIAVVVVLLFARSLPRRWIALLMPPTGPGPSTGEVCVACNSRNVTLLAPMVYRCNACGHEGGDSWAARERARRNTTFQAWNPIKRRKSARRDLMEARTLILAGLGDLERAGSYAGSELSDLELRVSYATWNAHRLSVTEQWEHEQVKTSALGRLLEAQGKARDAQAKLGASLGDPVDASFDETAHPSELLAQGNALLGAVEAELRSLRRGARA